MRQCRPTGGARPARPASESRRWKQADQKAAEFPGMPDRPGGKISASGTSLFVLIARKQITRSAYSNDATWMSRVIFDGRSNPRVMHIDAAIESLESLAAKTVHERFARHDSACGGSQCTEKIKLVASQRTLLAV